MARWISGAELLLCIQVTWVWFPETDFENPDMPVLICNLSTTPKRGGQRCKKFLETYKKCSLEYVGTIAAETKRKTLAHWGKWKIKEIYWNCLLWLHETSMGAVGYLKIKYLFHREPFANDKSRQHKVAQVKLFFYKQFLIFWCIEEFACGKQCTLRRIHNSWYSKSCSRNVLDFTHSGINRRVGFYRRKVGWTVSTQNFLWVTLTCISVNSKDISRSNREYVPNMQAINCQPKDRVL